ncbi:MAG: cysteine--tRNA ligase [Candidatus Micrarchaeia archaeon]
MKIFNTIEKKEELFKSLYDKKVGLYTCGPTVYFYAHIGNMRNYIVSDVLKRTLLKNNYEVKHVMNLTDVGHNIGDGEVGEDKVRDEAKKEHKSVEEIVNFYTDAFYEDIKKLNIIRATITSRASENIKEILEFISILDKKGYLYKTKTGIYFDTSKFKEYGALSGSNFKKLNEWLLAGARVERPEGLKNGTDFAVWRFAKDNEKEMVWDTPFGRGFPGWHIECSTIAYRYLGETIDIHYGGIDHIPVHHTNEIAQSEARFDKKFVRYWVHSEFLIIDGKKMSKSLRNVYTLNDLIKRGYSPLSFRYMVMNTHYRKMLNFTFEGLKQADETLKSIYIFINKVSTYKEEKLDKELSKDINNFRKEFFEKVNDDLDLPSAIKKMHEFINFCKKDERYKKNPKEITDTLIEFDSILGLNFEKHLGGSIPKEAQELINEREILRNNKEFKRADEIRKILFDKYNITLEDNVEGTVWYCN